MTIEDKIEAWFLRSFHNNVVSRSGAAYAIVRLAVDKLKAELASPATPPTPISGSAADVAPKVTVAVSADEGAH